MQNIYNMILIAKFYFLKLSEIYSCIRMLPMHPATTAICLEDLKHTLDTIIAIFDNIRPKVSTQKLYPNMWIFLIDQKRTFNAFDILNHICIFNIDKIFDDSNFRLKIVILGVGIYRLKVKGFTVCFESY